MNFMTDEQRDLLSRRLKAAAEEQPEIEVLRTRLLVIGGVELVAPPNRDPDVPALVEQGELITGSVKLESMDSSRCHENLSELWTDRKTGLTAIGTGYALSKDGLWRQHSWGMKDHEIIETTKERTTYFGILLEGSTADAFAQANRGGSRRTSMAASPRSPFSTGKR